MGTGVTQKQYNNIQNGTFKDLYIGDYWTINGRVYRIAAFDYYWQTGDTNIVNVHHVTLVPDVSMASAKMNDTNTTAGGYVGSKMYTTNIVPVRQAIQTDFGSSHILNHRVPLTRAVEPSTVLIENSSWYDSTIELMTQQNVYGNIPYNTFGMINGAPSPVWTVDSTQYPLFHYARWKTSSHEGGSTWLRDVIYDSYFAITYTDGNFSCSKASFTQWCSPCFLNCGIILSF